MRLAGNDKPVRCSVCLQPPMVSDPQPEYVNFEAAYDGPVVHDPNGPQEGPPTVYMEKIVICDDCIRQAAGLLGFERVDDLRDHAAALEAHVDQLESEITDKDRAISDLTHTVGTLIDRPVKRPPGRPQLQGPETHKDEIREMRSARSKSEKVTKAQKKVASGSNGL